MQVLITGCAGFIGSSLAERLVKEGFEVIGIDCFTDYYPRRLKEKNLEWLKKQPNFTFYEADLLTCNLDHLIKLNKHNKLNKLSKLNNSIVVFHLAAQAGVRASWGGNFEIYTRNNVRVTQRLLEWAKRKDIKKFVYASSSSVYGDCEELPEKEESILKPVSPYGVTKLAGENLCYLYWKNFGIPTVSLRYFTVYGPRQRPDMAFHKFIKAILNDEEIEIYGDGNQTRDFTYIDDIVEANFLALNGPVGEVFNIGGGKRITVNKVVNILEKLANKKAKVKYIKKQKGDVKDTFASISKAKRTIRYTPKTKFEFGIQKEIEWLQKQ